MCLPSGAEPYQRGLRTSGGRNPSIMDIKDVSAKSIERDRLSHNDHEKDLYQQHYVGPAGLHALGSICFVLHRFGFDLH